MRFPKLIGGLAALLLIATACGGRSNDSDASGDPGITDTEITLGGSVPFTGPASAYGTVGKAITAYFDYLNAEKGGVKMGDGKTRKVKYIVYDDAYQPEQQLANAKKLVQQDKVFAMLAMLGTPTHLAAVDYLNKEKVPDLFVDSVSAQFSLQPKKWPWTIGYLTPSNVEVATKFQYLKSQNPDATIAVLYQNDDAGEGALAALQKLIKGTNMKIVAKDPYEVTEPSVDPQVTSLVNSGADVLWMNCSPKQGAQAIKRSYDLGYKGMRVLGSPCAGIDSVLKVAGTEASKGVITATYFKDVANPKWANDDAVVQAKEIISKYGKNVEPTDTQAYNGIIAAQMMVGVLERLKTPTREALMKVVRNIDPPMDIPLLLPGISVSTGPDKLLPISTMQAEQFDGTSYLPVGDPVTPKI